MKHVSKLILITLIATLIPLSGCANRSWSWWDDDNLSIDKGIRLIDAKNALEKASNNAFMVSKVKQSYSLNEYTKSFKGAFASEIDYDNEESRLSEQERYENDVVITTMSSTKETIYKTAKQYNVTRFENYLIPQNDKSILSRTLIDYGYGSIISGDYLYPFTSESNYEAIINVGAKVDSAAINWNQATYGLAKNKDIIIETFLASFTSTIKSYDGTDLPIVMSNYNLYRLHEFINASDEIDYVIDYQIQRNESRIATNYEGKLLNEPYLLRKEETTTLYSCGSLGSFDLENIPPLSE